jgi:hypothetical protein
LHPLDHASFPGAPCGAPYIRVGLVQLTANTDRCLEVFPVDRLHELLGIPPGNYERVDNLMRKVIDPGRFSR